MTPLLFPLATALGTWMLQAVRKGPAPPPRRPPSAQRSGAEVLEEAAKRAARSAAKDVRRPPPPAAARTLAEAAARAGRKAANEVMRPKPAPKSSGARVLKEAAKRAAREASKEVRRQGGIVKAARSLAEALARKRKPSKPSRPSSRTSRRPSRKAAPIPPKRAKTPKRDSSPLLDRIRQRTEARERRRAAQASSQGQRQAANELYRYLTAEQTNPRRWGTRGSPNARIEAWQRRMGGLRADGIYGPATRKRGRDLTGRAFPARTAARSQPSTRPAPAPAPAPRPAPRPSRQEREQVSQLQAARSLYTYVTQVETNPRRWGTRGNPNSHIQELQRRMGGLTPDGIYGPATRRRGKDLTGRTFPTRTATATAMV